MIESKHKRRTPRKQVGNIWRELADICRKIHIRLYRNHDQTSARRNKHRLEDILQHLPKNDLAIIRHEGAALLSEMKGDWASAIQHRRKEIELTERAQKSVQESVRRGDYDAQTAAWVLEGRDSKALEERQAILRSLEKLKNNFQQRDGVINTRPRRKETKKQGLERMPG